MSPRLHRPLRHPLQRTPSLLVAALVTALVSAGCQPPQEPSGEPATQAPATSPGERQPAAQQHAAQQQAAQQQPITSLEELPEGVNIVQYEMQVLTGAMQNILRHIADSNLEAIPTEIGRVHPIYELTHQALEQGLYRPPHNGDDLEGFEKLDHAFHDDLVQLVRASRSNDLGAATSAYGRLVEGCTSCHTQFRFAPTAE